MNPSDRPANPLSGPSLALSMSRRLDPELSPQLKAPLDTIALAVNSGMENTGFRLRGLGEDHQLNVDPDEATQRPLPSEWNASSMLSFRYSHPQSAMQFLVNISRLGPKAVIDALALGDDKSTRFEITLNDYISPSSLPATPRGKDATEEEATKSLQDIFISAGRLSDLGSLLQISVIQKLAPKIHKEGYEEQSTTSSSTEADRTRTQPRDRNDPEPNNPPPRPHPLADPLAEPRRPHPVPTGDFPPPGFEDEYEINRPPRGFPPGGQHPLNIGAQDLYPPGLGPHDPLVPHLGPQGGLGGFGGGGGMGGGMHPTFDDPLFAGGRPGGGRQGGQNPQAPPGARWDPLGPGGGPRGGGFPGRGGPPNPFGGFGDGDFI